jgi:hypothetical protein
VNVSDEQLREATKALLELISNLVKRVERAEMRIMKLEKQGVGAAMKTD